MAEQVPGGKGLLLEEALRAHFHAGGYYTIRAVPIRLVGDDVTDVDLWLYERPGAMSGRKWIVDLKYKKTPKAAERAIWVRGLQEALEVDGSIVATTDKRPAIAQLCKKIGVHLLDGDFLTKVRAEQEATELKRFSLETVDRALKEIDQVKRSTEWRDRFSSVRSSVLQDFGIQSGNAALLNAAYFADQSVMAHPGSVTAQWSTRLFYYCVGLALAGLHYATTQQTFASPEERRGALVQGLRYGQSTTSDTISAVRMAIGLARKYAENGNVVSRQIERGFLSDAEKIPAEVVADFVGRISEAALFDLARRFDEVAFSVNLQPYDELATDMKAGAGVVLDFGGVSREQMAKAWAPGMKAASPTLFDHIN